LELESSLTDLKQEHRVASEENEKLKSENKNLMESLRTLNKELKEARIAKFEEVSQLTNKINENQLEFDRLNNEVQHLKRELDFNNLQLKKLQDFDYPSQMRQKETQLHESEKQRNKLQDDLALAHKQYRQNMEDMTKKIIEVTI
jgi:chromosome segregation ATPase